MQVFELSKKVNDEICNYQVIFISKSPKFQELKLRT